MTMAINKYLLNFDYTERNIKSQYYYLGITKYN